MKRREFIQLGGLAAAWLPPSSVWLPPSGGRTLAAQSPSPGVLKRIGITTVCFRDRFASTREKNAGPIPAGQELTLLTAPKFIADTLGLHNVEIWSAQFAEMSPDYCKKIKAAAEGVGSRIINIQVDGSENLSDPDAAKRAQSIATIKEWMDRAAAVGASTCRANTGGGPPEGWDVNRTADSFRQLANYGKKIGVKILVENHIGYSADIDKVVAVAKAVNDPYCRVISDWGNTPSSSPEARVTGLSKLFPYLELVSAKQLDFDEQNRHVNYDVVPLIKATEASGYKGIYSIEFYGKPPKDTVAAAKEMIKALTANIRAYDRNTRRGQQFDPLALRRQRHFVARSRAVRQHVADRVLVQELVGHALQRRNERGFDDLLVTASRILRTIAEHLRQVERAVGRLGILELSLFRGDARPCLNGRGTFRADRGHDVQDGAALPQLFANIVSWNGSGCFGADPRDHDDGTRAVALDVFRRRLDGLHELCAALTSARTHAKQAGLEHARFG